MFVISIMLYLFCSFALIFGVAASAQDTFSGQFEKLVNLREGEVVEVSAGLPAASKLPPNARIEVEWAGMRKVLHALDPDFFVYFRAPKTGSYKLSAKAVEQGDAIFNLLRWREIGSIAMLKPFPKTTPWPKGLVVPWHATVKPVNLGVATDRKSVV